MPRMHRPPRPAFHRRPLNLAVLAACAALASTTPALAVDYNTQWIDWYAKGPGKVFGTLQQGSEQVQVTFEGDYFHAFTDYLPESYWGPKTTYLNAVVDLEPPRSDVIVIAGGPNPLKLSFSQSVANPILAIASLGLKNESGNINLASSMAFDQPFQVLSNGPNYYSGFWYDNYSSFLQSGTLLTGVESSGTIRFDEPLTRLQWLSPFPELDENGTLVGTYLFTVGVNCVGYRIGPTPMSEAGAVPKGCWAYNDRAFEQRAPLEVRGELRNQTGGDWLQAQALRVAGDARMSNDGHYLLGEGQTLTVDGRLTNGGDLDVRGILLVNPGGRVDHLGHLGGLVTLKADNTLPATGLLRVELGGEFVNQGTITFEGAASFEGTGGRAQVAGTLVNQLFLSLEGYNAELEVLAGGLLSNQALMTVAGGSLLNRGEVQVDVDGELLFERDSSVEFGDQKPLLDNRGTLKILNGGLMRVQGEARQGGWGGSEPALVLPAITRVTQGAQGTLQVDGELRLDGQLINAGRVEVGNTGLLRASGWGSFEQLVGGTLAFAGSVELVDGGGMTLDGLASTVGVGDLYISPGSTLTIRPGGNLRFAPGSLGLKNQGTLVNQGLLTLEATLLAEGYEFHENWGVLDNRGQLRIGPHATLVDSGEIRNSGRFVVEADGVLITSVVTQTAGGVFVNNGLVQGGVDNVFVRGGRVMGSGTFEALQISLGEAELDAGNSPGTLTFTGDLILAPDVVVNMELTENDGGDRLVVGGALQGNGATLRFLFPDGAAPGLDQVFTFLDTPGGLPSDFYVDFPADQYARYYDLGPSATGGSLLAVALAGQDAGWLLPEEVGGWFFNRGRRYVEADIQRPGGSFLNEGVLGIRNLEGAGLGVGHFYNAASGQLLVSGRFAAAGRFDNLGLVKNRAGALFVNGGQFINEAGARFENRGSLRNEAGGRIVNRGEFLVLGEVVDAATLGQDGVPTLLNDGGRFVVTGAVSGQGQYTQRGEQAETVVDGRLQAAHIDLYAGALSGAGVLQGAVGLWGGTLAPGHSPGTLTVEGSLTLLGGEVLIEIAGPQLHDRIVVTGDVYQLDAGSLIRFRLLDGYLPAPGEGWTWLETGRDNYLYGLSWVLEAWDPQGGAHYVLADPTGIHDPHGLLPEQVFFEFSGDRLALMAQPVPEPETWAMLAAGLGLVGWAARRRARPS